MNLHQTATTRKGAQFTPEELALRDRLDAEACEADSRRDQVHADECRTQLRRLFERVGARTQPNLRWGEARNPKTGAVVAFTPEEGVTHAARHVAMYEKINARHAEMRAAGGTVRRRIRSSSSRRRTRGTGSPIRD